MQDVRVLAAQLLGQRLDVVDPTNTSQAKFGTTLPLFGCGSPSRGWRNISRAPSRSTMTKLGGSP